MSKASQAETVIAGCAKYQKMLEAAAEEKETGWFRLNIQLVEGQVERIQINHENQFYAPEKK